MANLVKFGGKAPSGNAVASDLLSGKTATVEAGEITGTMANNGAVNYTPSTSNQTIVQGYHNGSGIVYGDADLISANIKSGTNIFGVAGNSNVVDTSAGTAVASDILSGKIAFVDGTQITGTIPSKTAQTYTPSTSTQTIASGQYLSGTQTISGDADLVAGNIKSGVNIFGVDGTYQPTLQIQVGASIQSNNIGTVNIDKDLGSARPCYVYAGGFNRWNLWIYGSNNGSSWDLLTSTTGGDNTTREITVSTSSYRYIRASANGINNGGHNSLFMSVTYI